MSPGVVAFPQARKTRTAKSAVERGVAGAAGCCRWAAIAERVTWSGMAPWSSNKTLSVPAQDESRKKCVFFGLQFRISLDWNRDFMVCAQTSQTRCKRKKFESF